MTMRSESPASIRIAAVGGIDADLGWLRGIVVPAGVDVEFVDLGRRVDVAASHGDLTVTVIADLGTGERAIRTNGPVESALTRFVLHMVQQRQIAERSATLRAQPRSSMIQDFALLDGAVVLNAGEQLRDAPRNTDDPGARGV